MRLLVQAGHYPAGGGAPGEAAWTWKLAGLLRTRLEAAGVACVVVGDWFNQPAPAAVRQDYALYVALHYDAAVYGPGQNTGCFADRARYDPQAAASDRAIRAWEAVYPAALGLPLRNDRRNPNTWAYYGFADTSAATPGILLEHGVGAPVGSGGYPPGEDAALLHQQIERVAAADATAILRFLGLDPPEGEEDDMATIAELQAQLAAQEGILRELQSQLEGQTYNLGLAQAERDAQAAEVTRLREDVLVPLEAELAAVKQQRDACEARWQAAQDAPLVGATAHLDVTLRWPDGRTATLPLMGGTG